jgi:DNA polymerase I-like protein with 3'-5' exonuclease and polymerase domains
LHQILVIGDRLSEEEVTLNSGPFTGPYSYKFKRWLKDFHPTYINLSETKSKVPNGPATTTTLLNRIKALKPSGVLACGRQVGEALGLITDNALSAFNNHECHRYMVAGVPTVLIVHPREDMLDSYYPQHIQYGILKLKKALEGYVEPPFVAIHESLQEVMASAKTLKNSKSFCFDIETPMMKSRADLSLRSIAWTTDGRKAYSLSVEQYGQMMFDEVVAHVLAAIEDPEVLKVGQNIFFDLSVLNQIYGTFVKGPVHCSMQVENLIAHQFPKSLNDLAKRYLDVGPWKGGHKASGHELRFYNCQDVIYTFRIFEKQVRSMHELGLYGYWERFRKPLFEPTFHMAMTGLKVDTDLRTIYQVKVKDALIEPLETFQGATKPFLTLIPPKETIKEVWDKANDVLVPNVPISPEQLKSLKGESWKLHLYACGINKDIAPDYYIVKKKASKDFGWTVGEVRRKAYRSVSSFEPYIAINPGSPAQLKLLFAAMEIPKVRTRNAVTKKYVTDSTGSDALRKILATKTVSEAQSNVLISLLHYRELSKVLQTYYCMPLDPGGIWRYTYDQDGADTGRSTSAMTSWGTGGNSQNLPSRTKNKILKELKFKNLIVPREGRVFFTPDQASAESVVVAYLSNCSIMIEEFKKAEPDFHKMVAKLCFEFLNPGKSFGDLDKDLQKQLRNDSKAISHGASYGMHVDTLRESYFKATGKFQPRADIEGLLIAWHKAFEQVKMNWHNLAKARIDSGEPWYNCFGRRYYFSGVRDFNSLQEMLAKEPQGIVPDITNLMLMWAHKQLVPTGKGVVVQHGHDAFLCEVNRDFIREFCHRFFEESGKLVLSFPTGDVSMRWDGQIGTTWGNVKKWTEWLKENDVP